MRTTAITMAAVGTLFGACQADDSDADTTSTTSTTTTAPGSGQAADLVVVVEPAPDGDAEDDAAASEGAGESGSAPGSADVGEVDAPASGHAVPYSDPDLAGIVDGEFGWGEVADTIEELGLDVQAVDAAYWGSLGIAGVFTTTEVSGCWTDHALLNATVEVYIVDGWYVGTLSPLTGDNPTLHHQPGERCGTSDQGPVVTDAESVEFFALGWLDPGDDPSPGDDVVTMMIEGHDSTEWTLASGGSLGVASFLGIYLGEMYANADVGGIAAFSVPASDWDAGTTLRFEGVTSGPGSITDSRAVMTVSPDGVIPPDATAGNVDWLAGVGGDR